MLARLPAGRRLRLGRKAGLATTAVLLVAGGAAVVTTAAGAASAGKNNGRAHQVLTSPQPASNADFTGNGANNHGPYDSTRDGSPSGNGNGNGNGTGVPCAGCVGKADNKNPPGQMPGGSDANAGYECDRNHGIGRSNPAHTSCLSTTPTPTSPPTTPPSTPPSTPPTTPPTTPPSTPPTTPPSSPPSSGPSIPGQELTPPGGQALPAQAAEAGQGGPGQVVEAASTERPLASTGVPVLQMVLMALVALAGGIGLAFMGRARRRRASSTT